MRREARLSAGNRKGRGHKEVAIEHEEVNMQEFDTFSTEREDVNSKDFKCF